MSRKLCTYVKYLKSGIIFIRKYMAYYMSLKIKKIREFTVPFSYLFFKQMEGFVPKAIHVHLQNLQDVNYKVSTGRLSSVSWPESCPYTHSSVSSAQVCIKGKRLQFRIMVMPFAIAISPTLLRKVLTAVIWRLWEISKLKFTCI